MICVYKGENVKETTTVATVSKTTLQWNPSFIRIKRLYCNYEVKIVQNSLIQFTFEMDLSYYTVNKYR